MTKGRIGVYRQDNDRSYNGMCPKCRNTYGYVSNGRCPTCRCKLWSKKEQTRQFNKLMKEFDNR